MQLINQSLVAAFGQQMDEQLRVRRRLEQCALLLQVVADVSQVNQVAVVRNRDGAVAHIEHEGSDIF